MKTFLTAIPTLLLGAALATPAGAQLTIVQEGVSDPSSSGRTVILDSPGLGQRVTERLHLQFDPGGASSLTLQSARISGPGAAQFEHEIKDVSRLPVSIRNEFRLVVFVSYLPTGPGPAQATLEFTLRTEGSDLLPSDTVYTASLTGRVPDYSLAYAVPGSGQANVAPAGSISFGHKPTGVSTEATLVLTNRGSVAGVVESFNIAGSAAFAAASPPSFPVRLEAGGSVSLQLSFRPPSTSLYSGELSFATSGGTVLRYGLTGLGGDLFQFHVVSYAAGSNAGRSERVQSGTPVVFGQNAASVQVVAENLRQSAQLVESVRVSGPFVVSGAPALPASVAPGGSIAFTIEPSPAAHRQRAGELVIGDAVFPLSIDAPPLPVVRFTSAGGNLRLGQQTPVGLRLARSYPLDISGTLHLRLESLEAPHDPSLQWSSGGTTAAFDIPAGQTDAVFAGNAAAIDFQTGSISGEVVVSASFSAGPWGLDVTPAALPALRYMLDVATLPEVSFSEAGGALDAGRRVALGLSLAGPYPDEIAGTLQLSFVPSDLAGASGAWGSGRQVQFQIPAGGTTAMFGGNLATEFTAPASAGKLTVAARFITADGGADITPDPAPGLEFVVQVIPLPEVTFSQAGGTVGAAEQVPVQVSIAQAYPNDIVGVLNLAFETRTFAADPAIQWASGGRQASFLILAGTTQAIFSGQVNSNAFQTGTVAGAIVLTAQFFSVPNGYLNTRIEQALTTAPEITPVARPELRFNVMEAAPVLQRVTLGGTGQGGFNLQVTGYSTGRSVDSLSFAFAASPGSVLASESFNVDVAGAFRTYFSSNQSAASGGQFMVTVSFDVDEGAFEDIRSVDVTATNSLGTSNSVSLSLN